MNDFWPHCGYAELVTGADGRLCITEAYIRRYLVREELAPLPTSCSAERALHASLLQDPRREISAAALDGMADPDSRDNYRVFLNFRRALLHAPTLESFYSNLFRDSIAIPPDFIHETVQVIVRHLLNGCDNGLLARAGEVFFRQQRATVNEGVVLLGDAQTVTTQQQTGGLGNLGRMLLEVNVPIRSASMDVLNESNHSGYFGRSDRYDTLLQINPGSPGSKALATLLERWVGHFHGAEVKVEAVHEVPEEDWLWHIGLDAEATGLLNAVYSGQTLPVDDMRRILCLFRMQFADPSLMRPELQGAPVYLGMAMGKDGLLRFKPQNLLMNLPLASAA
jgi:hypothetical protein